MLWRVLWVMLMSAVGLSGCGSDGPQRVALSGIVTRAGQPLDTGTISFTPAQGQKGVAANGSIAKGRYQFSREDGPTPGLYNVFIQELFSKEELMRRRALQPASGATAKPWVKEVTVPDSQSGSLDISIN